MRVRLAVVTAVVFFGIASLLAAGRFARDPQTVRAAAPAFSVARFSDGRTVSLSDLRGKVVLLYFFFPT